ncbi:hypothetical protein F511_24063 [Dorcoceras hygrometricum]|uniref:Uncharacterized protein n=1 Tax=Dorcoceras hygrometricum TaxID=472368 RepID=A0A2Z7BFL9_9LAMI|nr:hypothetical protein F511_24063 [Dorcoceras hygrometricum]
MPTPLISVNSLQVTFESVLSMEHIGMVKMLKNLEESVLKGFLGVQCSVYEGDVIDFFANATVIAGTIVSFVANKKMEQIEEIIRVVQNVEKTEDVNSQEHPAEEEEEEHRAQEEERPAQGDEQQAQE